MAAKGKVARHHLKARRPRRALGVAGLPAKLVGPQAGDALPRARLFRALDRLARKPVTWIHAPAGAGKTTLLTTYLAARNTRVLWYDVDAGDADPSGLFHYVRLGAEHLLRKRLALPVPRPGSPDAQRAFARRFFEALISHLAPGTFLVFDNYQDVAGAPAWHDTFRELCAAVTARVRVIVASRAAPPACLARLGASGDLQLLDPGSLRLDEREVRHLLRRGGRSPATSATDCARLLSLTDGWAVAVALLSRPDASATRLGRRPSRVARPDGMDAVFKFLAGEVLDRLEAPARELLLAVALLPSFTAPMAAALSGRADTVRLLAKLHGDHLLVERTGEATFRLHDLFRLFLLERGRDAHGEEAWTALSVRAARLLADDDQFQPAAELLAAARSWTALGDLVERRAPALASQGRLATLGSALTLIPEEHREPRPWLLYWRAVLALGRQGGGASPLAEQAFHAMRASRDAAGTLLSWALVVQTIVIANEDFRQLGPWLRRLDELALLPPTPEIAVRVALGQVLAYSHFESGSLRSLEVADRALEVVRQHGTAEDRVLVGGAAIFLHLFGGRPERARELLRLTRLPTKTADSEPLARIACFWSEAWLEWFSGNMQASGAAADRGLALARETGIDAWNGGLMSHIALSATSLGDWARAELVLQEASVQGANQTRLGRGGHAYCRGTLAFEQGEIEGALRWYREAISQCDELGFMVGLCQSTIGEVVCEATRGDPAGVAAALARLEGRLGSAPSPLMEALAGLARTYAGLCMGEDVRESLRSALGRARQVGYRAFLGARVMSVVVAAALAHDIEPDFARSLVKAHRLRPGAEALGLSGWPWPLRIRALGPLQIEVEGRLLEFGRKTPARPLALLRVLVAVDEPITVERLTAALWPGYGDGAPRATLDTTLYRLRRLLGTEAAIESANGRVALAETLSWTDARALRLCCDDIAAAVRATDEPPGADTVERYERTLLDLYRGPLGENDDPPPVTRAREHLRRRFGRAIVDLGRLWARLGQQERGARLAQIASTRDEPTVVPRTA